MALFSKKKTTPEAASNQATAAPAKKSILTMDVKDLMKLLKPAPKSKKGVVSTKKRSMNFVHHKSNFNAAKMLPIILFVIIAAPIIMENAFLKPLDEKSSLYSTLAYKQEQFAQINASLTGYNELAAEYGRYSYGWMSEGEISLVDRLDVLSLIEEEIVPYATVGNFAVNNNTLTMNIEGITLEDASAMVNRLEQSPLVINASVYTATASDGQQASIFLSINLMKEVA